MTNTFKLITLCLIIASCNSNSANDSVEKADSINAARDNADNRMDDTTAMNRITGSSYETAEFLVRAANSGMAELQMTEMAMNKTSLSTIRDLSQTLNKDHAALMDQIRNLARERNIYLPQMVSNEKEDKISDLRAKSGNDFDKKYINELIDAHDNSIDMYEKAIKDVNDAAVRDFASQSLSKLRSHRDMAKNIKDKTW